MNISYWETAASNLPWFKKWDTALEWQLPFAHWFKGGMLNASYACLDWHIEQGRGDTIAYYWENEHQEQQTLTYRQLLKKVNECAWTLQKIGVKKNDNVLIYLPLIPEAIISMLAVSRIGACHSVVFSGFSSGALRDRIHDLHTRYIITADYGIRRGKKIYLKKIIDQALETTSDVKKVLVFQRGAEQPSLIEPRDSIYTMLAPQNDVYVKPIPVESNTPLFVLYTSGTTGKPKGIVHGTGGYLTYIYSTFKKVFNPNSSSLYWCTADIGWITGHSYVVYAPLLHGIGSLLYEGAPDYPDAGIWWKLIQKYKVTIFYTSPTALRMAMKQDKKWIMSHDLSSLQVLGTVGEPINPEVWNWYFRTIGQSRCAIRDTWWQTETGGFMISSTEEVFHLKPGSATFPLPEITPRIVDEQGNKVPHGTKGYLTISEPWPGMMIGIYNDEQKFKDVYWSKFPGSYYTGDYALQDKEGYFWLLGRADEVISIAGHRVGTAEIESAALHHPHVAESAALGIHDEIKGEHIILYVTLKNTISSYPTLSDEIKACIKQAIGSFVTPKEIYIVPALPKTRSGKIMRRLLKAVVLQIPLGDISTLEENITVQELHHYYHQLATEIQKPPSL